MRFLLILLFFLSSCQENPKPPVQSVRLNIHSEPPSLNPKLAADVTSINIIKMCFDGLMRNVANGQVDFALAKEVQISDDKKVYTFFLRDAHWSDGQPITACDFEASWRTILTPSFPSEFAYELYVIKNAKAAREGRAPVETVGVKAIDDHTLRVELEYSTPHFLNLVASHAFLATPQHIDKSFPKWADSEDVSHYVGSGPFKLVQRKPYNQILLIKNPLYWDQEQVKLEEVFLVIVEDESTELGMYESGELDWAGDPLSKLPPDALQALKNSPEMHNLVLAGTYYYVFNTRAFPFTNANIRKAFALAINRQEIVENITQDKQKPAMAYVPFTMWKKEIAYFKDNDQEEARRLFTLGLTELGIKKEELSPIILSYNTQSSHKKIAQAIQEQWSRTFGIRVQLDNKEWKVFLDELSHHNFQVARMGGIAGINDPTDFLDVFRYDASRRNFSQWTHPEFKSLLEQAEKQKDADARLKLLQMAEKILMEEMPVAPIYFYTGSYLKKPYLREVTVSEMSEIDLKKAYIDKAN